MPPCPQKLCETHLVTGKACEVDLEVFDIDRHLRLRQGSTDKHEAQETIHGAREQRAHGTIRSLEPSMAIGDTPDLWPMIYERFELTGKKNKPRDFCTSPKWTVRTVYEGRKEAPPWQETNTRTPSAFCRVKYYR